MKRFFTFVAIVFAVLVCGCTAPGPGVSYEGGPGNATTAEPLPPNLLGTWTGTMNGYDKGIGFNPHTGGSITLTVTGQHGRVFAGNLTILEGNAALASEGFAGTIGRDGRTVTIIEESGSCTGEIISPGEMEFVYMNDGPGYSISIDSLKRTQVP